MVIQPDTWCQTIVAAAAALHIQVANFADPGHLSFAFRKELLRSQDQQVVTTSDDSYRLRLTDFGFENLVPDPFSEYWVKFTSENSNPDNPGLIIGSGVVSQPALDVLTANQNARVILNDLRPQHLGFFWALHYPYDLLSRATPRPGRFPTEIDFPEGSLSSVLTERILHFLSPEELELGIQKVHRWLKPGGIWVTVEDGPLFNATPEATTVKYQQQFRSGVAYPGYLSTQEWFPNARRAFLPEKLNIFHPTVFLRRTLPVGFRRSHRLRHVETFSRPHYPEDILALDRLKPCMHRQFRKHLRRESWGCILVKEAQ